MHNSLLESSVIVITVALCRGAALVQRKWGKVLRPVVTTAKQCTQVV